MGNSVQSEPVIRFHDFQVNPETGEVWKNGIRLKLQDQPFKVLVALLKRPGEVVTREDLHKLIWPKESFGDFDHAINLAVAKLRAALGDSADVPHLIETLPRRGYRFIGTIEGYPSKVEAQSATLKGFANIPKNWAWAGAVAGVLISVCAVAVHRFLYGSLGSSLEAVEVVPLIAMEGKQGWPAFSPDGNQVAFAQYEGPNSGIYITILGGEKPLRLTENRHDCCPTWSPDGQQIAFVRYESENERSIYTIRALGGLERKLYTAPLNGVTYCDGMSWAPDGKALIFAERKDEDFSHISVLSIADLTAKPLTFSTSVEGDCEPAYSPDGSTVAFVRGTAGGDLGDLFVIPVSGGPSRRITSGNSGGTFAWTRDGREVVFSSAVGGLQTLWRVAIAGGTARPVVGVAGPAVRPSISHRGTNLAYQQAIKNENIWRIDLKDEKHSLGRPVRAFSSRGFIYRPSFSPDGKKVAFESDRMGYSDIWVCDLDGSNCTQMSDQHTETATARWSPDGHYLSFESAYQHFWQPFTVEMPGGRPHLLNTGLHGYIGCPNWSRDGQWIYICSDQSGRYEVWKVPSKGGSATQVTTYGGAYAIESDDGNSLYYWGHFGDGKMGVWKKPFNGSEETRVLSSAYGNWSDWVVTHTGIYFIDRAGLPVEPGRPLDMRERISYLDLATGEITPIWTLEKPAPYFGGLAISSNGKTLYWGQTDRDDSYIMVVKNFH